MRFSENERRRCTTHDRRRNYSIDLKLIWDNLGREMWFAKWILDWMVSDDGTGGGCDEFDRPRSSKKLAGTRTKKECNLRHAI